MYILPLTETCTHRLLKKSPLISLEKSLGISGNCQTHGDKYKVSKILSMRAQIFPWYYRLILFICKEMSYTKQNLNNHILLVILIKNGILWKSHLVQLTTLSHTCFDLRHFSLSYNKYAID